MDYYNCIVVSCECHVINVIASRVNLVMKGILGIVQQYHGQHGI